MQKILNTAASLGAIVLFVAVAAPSQAAMVALGIYGKCVLYIGAPVAACAISMRKKLLGVPLTSKMKRLLRAYGVLTLLTVICSVTFNAEDEWAWTNFTSFQATQALGLLALLVTALAIRLVALERQRSLYRGCPFCLSRIPRAASRCKHCTSNVAPAQITLERANTRPRASEFRRADQLTAGGPLPPWPSRAAHGVDPTETLSQSLSPTPLSQIEIQSKSSDS